MKFELLDCCPVPSKLYPILLEIKKEIGCTYNSLYRGQDPNAQKYLKGTAPCYKHNQAWIYANYPPGVANPPGYSTHECKNDGVAYSWPRGGTIPWWACGIDVDVAHVQAFINAAAKRGWLATITYPGSAVEYHHVNFRKLPKYKVFKDLKSGQRGPRVWILTWRLLKLGYMAKATAHFYDPVTLAVKTFQRKHHLTSDGIVGPATWHQLAVNYRQWKKHHPKGK